jgi:hypothetical protein
MVEPIDMKARAALIREARERKRPERETGNEIIRRLIAKGLRGDGQERIFPGGIDDMET